MGHLSGITFIRYPQSQTILKPMTLRVLGGKTIDGPNQDTKNHLRPHMPENKISLGHTCLRTKSSSQQ